MMAAFYIGLMIVSRSLAARLARRNISGVEFPTNDPSRKIPYIAGTVEISPQVIWWGDFKRSSVRTEFPTFVNFLFPITAILDQLPFGYRYYIGMVLGLCLGPTVTVKKITANDRIVWTGSQSDGTLTIAKPGEFGPDGGLYAVCDLTNGSLIQLRNPYFGARVTTPPAFRGTCTFYWRGPSSGDPALGKIKYSGYIGRSTVVKPMKFRLARFPNGLGSAYAIVNTNHANFAEVLYELLTNEVVGLGLATSYIDTAAFLTAAATLSTENLGCSMKWEQPTEISDILIRLLETMDAACYTRIDTGQVTLKLIRPDYTLASLTTIDGSQKGIEVVSLELSDPHNTIGEVRVPYTDVEKDMATGTALAQSLSNRNQQGYTSSITLERMGLGDAPAATKIATRELRAMCVPLRRMTIKVNREAYQLNVGDVFKFTWLPYNITDLPMRILEVDFGTIEDSLMEFKCVEDKFSISDSQLGNVVTTAWSDPIIVTPNDSAVRNVISMTVTAPPASPALGDQYVVPAGATGAWTGQTNQITTWNGTAWIFEPTADLTNKAIYDDATTKYKYWNGTAWIEVVTTAYNTIQDEGTAVTRREIFNFIGNGVVVADDVGNLRTNITITMPTDFDYKNSARAATTANDALATAYENGDVIDGVTLATGDRILLKDQTTGSENGIYTVNATGAPTRAADANTSIAVTAGLVVLVTEGTVNADSIWILTTNDPIVLGTTALVFARVGNLTVEESDGTPTEAGVTKLIFPKNTLSEPAVGQVRYKPLHLLVFEFDGFGNVLATTIDDAQIEEMPWDCTLLKWRVIEASKTPISATATIDVWKDAYANYPPTVADAMTGAGTKPNLASTTKNEGTDFTSWTTTGMVKGDVPRASLTAVTLAKKLRLVLTVEEL